MDPPAQRPRTTVLSEDLQLEIIARADDVATVVRCAAASKSLRRAIRGPAFRRRFANKGGFNPALLADVSYRIREYGYVYTKNRVVVNVSRCHQMDSSSLQASSFEPAWSRDGILILWRNRRQDVSEPYVRQVDLLVCNVFTGELTRPPSIYVDGSAGIAGDMYRPALLATEGGRHSLELLVMDKSLQIHTLSSLDGSKWADVRPRRVHSPQIDHQYFPVPIKKVCGAPAAVIGRIIHWLCHLRNPLNLPTIILAVDADTAEAAAIELPEGCLTSLGSWETFLYPTEDRLMLAATTTTTDKASRLSLLVAETTAISMWTLITPPGEGSNGWMWQAVIRRRELGVQLGSGLSTYKAIRFKAFGERSGTVLFWIDWVGLVQLSLVTNKAVLLRADNSNSRRMGEEGRACLHEVDMESLLRRMKSF
jgi:hypothetical protein